MWSTQAQIRGDGKSGSLENIFEKIFCFSRVAPTPTQNLGASFAARKREFSDEENPRDLILRRGDFGRIRKQRNFPKAYQSCYTSVWSRLERSKKIEQNYQSLMSFDDF